MIDSEVKHIAPKKHLSPTLWDGDKIIPTIRIKLLKVANILLDKADLDDLGIKPIKVTITGSMVNYNYSKISDIDLHIIYNGDTSQLATKYLSTLKDSFNTNYDFNIDGHEIEVYFQHEDEEHDSGGVYDLLKDEWITKPEPYKGKINVMQTKKEALAYIERINSSKTLDDIQNTIEHIKTKRKTGLSKKEKEYSPENLGYKIARNLGYIDYLYDKKKAMDKIETEYGI